MRERPRLPRGRADACADHVLERHPGPDALREQRVREVVRALSGPVEIIDDLHLMPECDVGTDDVPCADADRPESGRTDGVARSLLGLLCGCGDLFATAAMTA